ncbi:MAG TPA: fumarylacetoacetate hydrolase family protein [Burkholderiaceae bacterium]|nr:fumarylacetoacetate hydrolase family protein [Burkholderiaceae bacterium]
MKLVRYGAPGQEKPGLIDPQGRLRDLSRVIADIDGNALAPTSLARLAGLPADEMPLVPDNPRLGPPVARVSKFVAIGLNYTDHAIESNAPIPKEPIIFMKTPSSIVGANDDVMLPRGSKKMDWEIELAIVIGSRARYVTKNDALKHVAGYMICNDVSEREFQLERGPQWDKGKGCDTFGPIGPWIATTDEIPDPQNLDMWLDVNGEKRQRGNTKTMIFDCATLVSYVSEFMTLYPGDIITTGTPPGVGMGMKPQPQYLKAGDVVTLGIQGLGEQRQRVVEFRL